jgi:DNA polymerase III epsilon subunit-like protein
MTYLYFKKNNINSDLASLCQNYNIPLNHHDALIYTKACAKLYLISAQKNI